MSRYLILTNNKIMKKTFIILGLFLAIAISCSKSSDEPTYSQDKLNGTWENIVKDEDGCADRLLITASSMKEETICESSDVTVSYDAYSFDGKKMSVTVWGIKAEYVITELTDTKLVVTLNVMGTSEKVEYKKIN
jgi:hypothetical protein